MALLQELGIAAVAFLAVRMSEEAFSAHTIVMQSLLWLTSPLFGMMTATEVRIGNHLGAGDAAGARLVASLCLVMMMVLATPVSLTLILLKDQLGHLFTDDANVVHYMAQVLPIVGGVYLVMGVFFARDGDALRPGTAVAVRARLPSGSVSAQPDPRVRLCVCPDAVFKMPVELRRIASCGLVVGLLRGLHGHRRHRVRRRLAFRLDRPCSGCARA